jgi:multicomponent Na+:H+ antiporter subunit G
MLPILQDIFTYGSIFTGVLFIIIAGAGIIRLPDFYIRMSAITKAGTMGVGFILLGISIHFNDLTIAIKSFVIISFMLLTAPVAAHIISRAAYLQNVPFWERNLFDQLADRVKLLAETEAKSGKDPDNLQLKWKIIGLMASLPPSLGGSSGKLLKEASAIRKIDPVEGHLAFATVYLKNQNHVLAEKEFLNAVDRSKQHPRCLTELAKFYSYTRKPGESITVLERILQVDPDYLPALLELGKTSSESGMQLNRGEQCLLKVLDEHPQESPAMLADAAYYLGNIYILRGDKSQARQFYEKAIQFRKQHSKALYVLERI